MTGFLEGRRALITGASGAIGSEVARRLAGDGAVVVLSARRGDRLAALAEEIGAAGGAGPVVLVADLGCPGEAARLAARAVEAVGGIDLLVNNAGSSLQGLTWVVGDRAEAREVLETNLWSPFALAAALVPAMVERGDGVIVNVGSMARVAPFPHLGHYAASRAALASATEVMRMELGPRGVRVVEVALGPIDTPASRENRVLRGADRWLDGRPGLGEVAPAADAIVAAARSGDGVVLHPRALRWPHRLPGLGRHYAARMARSADLSDQTVRFAGREVAGTR